jgi:hypothetical protein
VRRCCLVLGGVVEGRVLLLVLLLLVVLLVWWWWWERWDGWREGCCCLLLLLLVGRALHARHGGALTVIEIRHFLLARHVGCVQCWGSARGVRGVVLETHGQQAPCCMMPDRVRSPLQQQTVQFRSRNGSDKAHATDERATDVRAKPGSGRC